MLLDDELESAKILFQEGLVDEAKKKLHQILIVDPDYWQAREFLEKIQIHEVARLFRIDRRAQSRTETFTENSQTIIDQLSNDLNLDLDQTTFDAHQENWKHDSVLSSHERYDLGVAFFEMGCYSDAIRELKVAIKQIRMEQTFLGPLV